MDASVHQFLQRAGLQEFAEKLHGLGVEKLDDLHEVLAEEGVASKIFGKRNLGENRV